MANKNKTRQVGVANAAAHLAVVRSALGIVVQTLLVMTVTFFLVGVFLNLLRVEERGIREFYEIMLTCIISLAVLYQIVLRPLTRLVGEHAAAAAESRFWAVAQAAQDGILIFDAEGRILFANKAAEAIYGFQAGTLQNKPLEILMPEDVKQEFRAGLESFFRTKESSVIGKGLTERTCLRTNGALFPVELSISELVVNEESQFIIVLRDISARKTAEREIQERTEQLNALLTNNPLGVVVLDKSQRIQMCNPAFEEMFQYRSAEIAGLDLDSLVAPVDLMEEATGMTKLGMQGRATHAITRRQRKDRSLVDVEIYSVALQIGGQLEGAYAIYQDISERKKLKLYEQILPVCCMCGKIRDDEGSAAGEGSWDRLDQYITKHSDAKLSHTFCPPCLEEYRTREGLT